jgi:brefeldin A-resistance guanine nucleotide exchange factor 1
VFDNTEDRIIFEKSILGINNCAAISAAYNLSDVFDYIILSLAQVAGLVVNERLRQSDSFANNPQSFRSPDDILTDFGRNMNQRFACILMFSLVFKYPALIKEGWNHVRIFF